MKKKSRIRAVRRDLAGPEKAVRPYEKSVRTRDCREMEFETIGFNNFEFKMSDSCSEDYSESKEYPSCLNVTI